MINLYFTKIILTVVSYFVGAIPFGLITAMVMGAGDIRNMGSGNIGATNVLRTTGKLGGAITLLLDALKGFIPVYIAKSLWGMDTWTLVIAFIVVTGHNYSVYLKFKGGKGVATSFGVLFALWPVVGFITLGIWIVSIAIWKYSSLGALISFALLPIIIILGEKSISYLIFSILISSMIYIRHIGNIKRLVAGEEKRVGGKSRGASILLIILLLLSFSVFGSVFGSVFAQVNTSVDNNRPIQNNVLPLLIRDGYIKIEQGQAEEAYKIGVRVKDISPDYAPASYLTAMSLRKMSKILPAISEITDGVKKSFKDFWSLFNMTGRVVTVFTISLALTSLTVLLAWMLRILPVFHHIFRENTSKYIDYYLRPFFFGTIIVLPVFFGIGWFENFWITCLWLYLTKMERKASVLILVFFLSMPLILKYNAIFITGHENITLQGLIAADKGIGDPDLLIKLKKQYINDPDNTYLPLSIATIMYKGGDFSGAIEYYNRLLVSDQKSVKRIAFNNLGNIYFKNGNYDKAIDYYKAAEKESVESAIPSFNLSQAFRESLMFEEADQAYKKARNISIQDAEQFSVIINKGAAHVMDYPVNKDALWHVALQPNDYSRLLSKTILQGLFRISGDRFYFLVFSIMIILTVLSYIKPVTPMAYHCPECNRIVCGYCTGSKVFGGLCLECRRKGEKENIAAGGLDKRLSFFLPGLWHIYKGKTLPGVFINLIFYLGITVLISGNLNDTWYTAYYHTSGFYLLGIFLICISYLMLLFNFKYIRVRFN
ncbi:MAG: glycerol-3-phosphate 1-O-acyltransferase PlsY [Nitrospira sp.]|nr:glycerol-3-phosphate 1-O-acyltransferase PlsY [Nitrospira sp.]